MLRILILPLLLIFLTAPYLSAQSLQLSTEEEGNLEDGQTIIVKDSADVNVITKHLTLTNTSDEPTEVRVRRVENNVQENTINYFCWAGSCYPPNTDTATNTKTLEPGETTSEFYADYQPQGISGIASISYFFYNDANPSDEVSAKVVFDTREEATIQLSTEEHGTLNPEQVVTVEGTVDSSLLKSHITVTNTGNDTIDVLARRVENSLVEETVNYFCWGLCYPNVVDTSSVAVTLYPGESTSEFYGDYEPHGHSGTTSVSYYFYEKGNPSNETGVEIRYTVETSVIGDAPSVSGLNVYPVPADEFINIELKSLHTDAAKVRLVNLAGVVVKQLSATYGQDEIRLSTAGLKNGIYLLSIVGDAAVINTRKIIISH